MQISRSGRANDGFLDNLAKLMPKQASDEPKEMQLEQDRAEKLQKAEADGTTEKQLPEAGERKDEKEAQTYEGRLEESRMAAKAAAPNADKEGITEQRLNDASKESYPHRNEKAYKRTGEKRPVNALREEMGNASDADKNERYEKANKAGDKRIVDQDVGAQLTNPKTQIKAFNLKQTKMAAQAPYAEYIAYKNETEGGVKMASLDNFTEVRELDSLMSDVMAAAQKANRALTEDEIAKISALKLRKTAILIKQK